MNDLENKAVLITGGNKGIGKGIALEFARRGAKLAIGFNSNTEAAAVTLKELNELTDAAAIRADISTPEGCKRLVEEALEHLGRLDVLVNNAALQTQYSIIEGGLENLIKIINTNLRSAYMITALAHAHLKKSGNGRVIFISSVHGKRPLDFDSAYSVSKGALEMLMREAAAEFAGDGITVNSIAPAGVLIEGKTGNPRPIITRNTGKRHFNKYLLGRFGLPSDTASLACFLASEEACHITGATLRVDGGSMLL
jgi:glucose 1-dehydrogenase